MKSMDKRLWWIAMVVLFTIWLLVIVAGETGLLPDWFGCVPLSNIEQNQDICCLPRW